ncbi:protein GOLM2 isoform X2 [Misgurnus anguillicaudatus]|uniref:protein GOLM2 isoform X2 n=1 Tax=Misgurnus anguillicaudatus TaxID=75329 RepID=UPI003CCF092A
MIGFSANRRGGRLPSFILIALLVIIGIVSFNYWSVSSKHGRLLDELAEVQTQVKRTDAARSRLEKRNSELMMQVDAHRKQIEQKDGDYSTLESKLENRDAQLKSCNDEKNQLQIDVSAKMLELHKLEEQMKELRQEIIRQEDQLREVRKNSTNLEKKLEYESLQCGRQMTELKAEYEESKKRAEDDAAKLRKNLIETGKKGGVGRQVDLELNSNKRLDRKDTAEHHTVAPQHDGPGLKDEMVKPGSDAGMPGIEDSEVGKIEVGQFALKKPAITQKHMEPAEAAAMLKEERAGLAALARPGDDHARGQPLDQPDVPHDESLHLRKHEGLVQQQVPKPVADKPMLFDEDNKVAIKADEFGEQRRQLGAPEDFKAEGVGLPPPPNPAQVLPKPIDPHNGREPAPADPPRHRQNDEDREAPGERAVEYGKRHKAIDIL